MIDEILEDKGHGYHGFDINKPDANWSILTTDPACLGIPLTKARRRNQKAAFPNRPADMHSHPATSVPLFPTFTKPSLLKFIHQPTSTSRAIAMPTLSSPKSWASTPTTLKLSIPPPAGHTRRSIRTLVKTSSTLNSFEVQKAISGRSRVLKKLAG